jgi:hypothetical protein
VGRALERTFRMLWLQRLASAPPSTIETRFAADRQARGMLVDLNHLSFVMTHHHLPHSPSLRASLPDMSPPRTGTTNTQVVTP